MRVGFTDGWPVTGLSPMPSTNLSLPLSSPCLAQAVFRPVSHNDFGGRRTAKLNQVASGERLVATVHRKFASTIQAGDAEFRAVRSLCLRLATTTGQLEEHRTPG